MSSRSMSGPRRRVSARSRSAGEVLAGRPGAMPPAARGRRCVLDAQALWSDLAALIRDVIDRAGAPAALGVACQLGPGAGRRRARPDGARDPLAGPYAPWPRPRSSPASLGRARAPSPDAVPRRSSRDPGCAGWPATSPEIWARTRWVLEPQGLHRRQADGAGDDRRDQRLVHAPVRCARPRLVAGLAGGRRGAGHPAAARPRRARAGGGIGRESRPRLDVPAGTPVAVGGPDGSVAALGSGAVRAGLTVDVAGSTDVLLHLCDRPILDPERRSILNAFLLPGLWTVGGPTGLTGGAAAWLSGVLGYGSVEDAYRRSARPRPRSRRARRGDVPHGPDRRAVPDLVHGRRRFRERAPAGATPPPTCCAPPRRARCSPCARESTP